MKWIRLQKNYPENTHATPAANKNSRKRANKKDFFQTAKE